MNRPIVKSYVNKTNTEMECWKCDEPININEHFKGINDIGPNGEKLSERYLCECCAEDELESFSEFY
jgi:hypothetical protein